MLLYTHVCLCVSLGLYMLSVPLFLFCVTLALSEPLSLFQLFLYVGLSVCRLCVCVSVLVPISAWPLWVCILVAVVSGGGERLPVLWPFRPLPSILSYSYKPRMVLPFLPIQLTCALEGIMEPSSTPTSTRKLSLINPSFCDIL